MNIINIFDIMSHIEEYQGAIVLPPYHENDHPYDYYDEEEDLYYANDDYEYDEYGEYGDYEDDEYVVQYGDTDSVYYRELYFPSNSNKRLNLFSNLEKDISKEKMFCSIAHDTIEKGSDIFVTACNHTYTFDGFKKYVDFQYKLHHDTIISCPLCRTKLYLPFVTKEEYMKIRKEKYKKVYLVKKMERCVKDKQIKKIENDERLKMAKLLRKYCKKPYTHNSIDKFRTKNMFKIKRTKF